MARLEIPPEENVFECPTSLYSWGLFLGTSFVVVFLGTSFVVVFFTIRPVYVYHIFSVFPGLCSDLQHLMEF